jgi:hypothetical protein
MLIYNEVEHLKCDNIGFKEFLGISYFIMIYDQSKIGIFSVGIICSDLMSVKQRLIYNFVSVQWRMVDYSVKLRNSNHMGIRSFKISPGVDMFK